ISNVVEMANRISEGDLGQVVEVTSGDEIGQMLEAMNEMVRYLDEMAKIADAIATGDLRVQVKTRSDADVFGTAFNKMVESLHAIIQELTEGATRLSSAASELATTSNQQSAMISEQATSIQESLVTLEEIRTIVNQ